MPTSLRAINSYFGSLTQGGGGNGYTGPTGPPGSGGTSGEGSGGYAYFTFGFPTSPNADLSFNTVANTNPTNIDLSNNNTYITLNDPGIYQIYFQIVNGKLFSGATSGLEGTTFTLYEYDPSSILLTNIVEGLQIGTSAFEFILPITFTYIIEVTTPRTIYIAYSSNPYGAPTPLFEFTTGDLYITKLSGGGSTGPTGPTGPGAGLTISTTPYVSSTPAPFIFTDASGTTLYENGQSTNPVITYSYTDASGNGPTGTVNFAALAQYESNIYAPDLSDNSLRFATTHFVNELINSGITSGEAEYAYFTFNNPNPQIATGVDLSYNTIKNTNPTNILLSNANSYITLTDSGTYQIYFQAIGEINANLASDGYLTVFKLFQQGNPTALILCQLEADGYVYLPISFTYMIEVTDTPITIYINQTPGWNGFSILPGFSYTTGDLYIYKLSGGGSTGPTGPPGGGSGLTISTTPYVSSTPAPFIFTDASGTTLYENGQSTNPVITYSYTDASGIGSTGTVNFAALAQYQSSDYAPDLSDNSLRFATTHFVNELINSGGGGGTTYFSTLTTTSGTTENLPSLLTGTAGYVSTTPSSFSDILYKYVTPSQTSISCVSSVDASGVIYFKYTGTYSFTFNPYLGVSLASTASPAESGGYYTEGNFTFSFNESSSNTALYTSSVTITANQGSTNSSGTISSFLLDITNINIGYYFAVSVSELHYQSTTATDGDWMTGGATFSLVDNSQISITAYTNTSSPLVSTTPYQIIDTPAPFIFTDASGTTLYENGQSTNPVITYSYTDASGIGPTGTVNFAALAQYESNIYAPDLSDNSLRFATTNYVQDYINNYGGTSGGYAYYTFGDPFVAGFSTSDLSYNEVANTCNISLSSSNINLSFNDTGVYQIYFQILNATATYASSSTMLQTTFNVYQDPSINLISVPVPESSSLSPSQPVLPITFTYILEVTTTPLTIYITQTVESSNYLTYTTGDLYITKLPTNTKTFVIDHPTNPEKYLVHACLEGPESGVYYRGTGKITNNHSTTIDLPHYVEALATDLTIQVTPIYDETNPKTSNLSVSKVKNNKFQVYGENGEFYWIVHGKRNNIVVEPNKKDIILKGDGPYKWI